MLSNTGSTLESNNQRGVGFCARYPVQLTYNNDYFMTHGRWETTCLAPRPQRVRARVAGEGGDPAAEGAVE